MKYPVIIIKIICVLSLFSFSGCVKEHIVKLTTIHLQDATVTGPVNQSPVHVSEKTEAPLITVSPRFSYIPPKQVNAHVSGHTPVNSQGKFEVDTISNSETFKLYYPVTEANIYNYNGRNLTWNLASVSAGLDFDTRFTKNFGSFAGINYTSSGNQNIFGGNAGIAFLLITDNLGMRLDAGILIQSIAYDAHTVEIVQTASTEYIVFYHDIDKSTHFNPFFGLTINSVSANAFVNFFVNLGYSWQTLVGFTPENRDETMYSKEGWFIQEHQYKEVVRDLRGTATAGYINITPGLFFRISNSSRILTAIRCLFDNGLDDATTSIFLIPMMQIDFLF